MSCLSKTRDRKTTIVMIGWGKGMLPRHSKLELMEHTDVNVLIELQGLT